MGQLSTTEYAELSTTEYAEYVVVVGWDGSVVLREKFKTLTKLSWGKKRGHAY